MVRTKAHYGVVNCCSDDDNDISLRWDCNYQNLYKDNELRCMLRCTDGEVGESGWVTYDSGSGNE
ncbi:unnamed protein product [Ceratitis capitata]|uniref:(Mediterranean fruit fly) hypothetical protein n=1 Tax=Ceratitis capitata TaxID=7213 RepID=A0A811VIH7_CERCA|nr:unnamed protein product [Ceratitis capitata]